MMAETTSTEPSSPRGRILIADDDELFSNGICQWLERRGYDCTRASNANLTLEALRTGSFEALVSDIHMPGNADLEMISQLPQVSAGLPIILLTGRPTVETAARSVRFAVTAYLVKPPDLNELDNLIQTAITQYRQTKIIAHSQDRLRDWDQQLAAISKRVRLNGNDKNENHLGDFLSITLRNIIAELSDLEETNRLWRAKSSASATPEHINALRHVVAVLEQTKQNFKCKQLAELRKQVQELIEHQDHLQKN